MQKRHPLKLSLLAIALSVATAQASDDKTKWDVNKPQGEFKSIDINVSSGTWMNLDISPDGKTSI